MNPLSIIVALTINGLSENSVILTNETGLRVARVEIDDRKIESYRIDDKIYDRIGISVSPAKHNLKVIFLGGATVNWPHLDFKGVHEIFFKRVQNKIKAEIE